MFLLLKFRSTALPQGHRNSHVNPRLALLSAHLGPRSGSSDVAMGVCVLGSPEGFLLDTCHHCPQVVHTGPALPLLALGTCESSSSQPGLAHL